MLAPLGFPCIHIHLMALLDWQVCSQRQSSFQPSRKHLTHVLLILSICSVISLALVSLRKHRSGRDLLNVVVYHGQFLTQESTILAYTPFYFMLGRRTSIKPHLSLTLTHVLIILAVYSCSLLST